MGEIRRRLPIFDDGVMPFVWLVYAAFVPLTLWAGGALRPVAVLQLAGFAVFLALYFLAYGRRGTTALLYAGAIALLGVVTAPTDPAAATYFVYAMTFVAFGVPTRRAYRILAAYVPSIGLVMWLTHVPFYGIASGTVFSVVVGLACISGAEQKRSHARLRQAYDEIERLAHIAERERIARDLHDVLGHTLSLITLKSQLASKLADRDPQRAAAEIRDVERIARTSLDELRTAVAGYRAAGIGEELAHARDVLASAGLRVDCEADDVRLAPAVESVLALAIREAVTNVVRHARATAVRLRLGMAGDTCRFEIHDDGVGATGPEGFGLIGMRERVEQHGGSLERRVERGTHLVVTLPLAPGGAAL